MSLSQFGSDSDEGKPTRRRHAAEESDSELPAPRRQAVGDRPPHRLRKARPQVSPMERAIAAAESVAAEEAELNSLLRLLDGGYFSSDPRRCFFAFVPRCRLLQHAEKGENMKNLKIT